MKITGRQLRKLIKESVDVFIFKLEWIANNEIKKENRYNNNTFLVFFNIFFNMYSIVF